jgi:hypothetical protein
MRVESQPGERKGLMGARTDLERRYPWALRLYGLLAVLVWFTMGEGTILVHGKPVALRLIPLLVIGGFALRTVVARQADRIRRSEQEGRKAGDENSRPESLQGEFRKQG